MPFVVSPPRIAILTGAGVSAASGVPTFRGHAGLWRDHNPQDLATPGAFRQDPQLVWEFYAWRRQLIANCQPNRAHETLAAMDGVLPDLMLVTQNIDGLHTQAGSKRVLTLHGDIWRLRCTACDYEGEDRRVPLIPLPPTCPVCSALLRPAVVWFGESLDRHTLQAAVQAFSQADVALVVGTSALVYPAAELPSYTLRQGGEIYEFNQERTPLSAHCTATWQGPCEETLPPWWQAFRAAHNL